MPDTPTDQTARGTPDHPVTDPLPHASKPAVTTDELVRALRPVVLDTVGVDRLVPTMATALSRLRLHRSAGPETPATLAGRETAPGGAVDVEPDTSGDGITVTLEAGAVTAVLDITVTSTASVLDTALAVRSAAEGVLEITHPGQYAVKVNVLGLAPGPARSRP